MKKDFSAIKHEVHRLFVKEGISVTEISRLYNNSPSRKTIDKWLNENNGKWKRERFYKVAGKYNELLPEKITKKIEEKIDEILGSEGAKFCVKSAENVVKLSLLLEKQKSVDTLQLYAVQGMRDFIRYLELFAPGKITVSLLNAFEDYLNFLEKGNGE